MPDSPFTAPQAAPSAAAGVARALPLWLGAPLLLVGALLLFFTVVGLIEELETARRATPTVQWGAWVGEWITPAGLFLYVGAPATWVGWASVRRRPRPRARRALLWLALLVPLTVAMGTVRVLTRPRAAPDAAVER